MRDEVREWTSKYAADHQPLVLAICDKESRWNALAMRFEFGYPYTKDIEMFAKQAQISVATETILQQMSLGLMQVMGGTLRDFGFKGSLVSIFTTPLLGVEYGYKYLLHLIRLYDGDIERVLSAYNAGPKNARKLAGFYPNQAYVNEVLDLREKYV